MRCLYLALLSLMFLAGPLRAAQADFTSTTAFEDTCKSATGRVPLTVQEQQAYVICNDVALVQHIWTFINRGIKRYERERPSEEALALAIRGELRYARDQLRKSRNVLERIQIRSPQDGLLITPAAWVRDLNGDGRIVTSERYFFAIPKRRDDSLALGMPSEDDDYYANEYNLAATVRLDQTDIYWALSYHSYIEALFEVALSYQYRADARTGKMDIRLVDAANMRHALQLLAKGLRTSEKMRVAALAETDDDLEWLANPRQANTVFPVPLDDEDFRIWGELMTHLIPLVDGKTLLPSIGELSGQFGRYARACPEGHGFDIAQLFRAPPKSLFALLGSDFDTMAKNYCRKIDRAHPASGIGDFITRYGERMETDGQASMRFLRRFLWVN